MERRAGASTQRQWMRSLNVWVQRYQTAMAEIRRLNQQVELLTRAFATLVTFLDDEQLAQLEAELEKLEKEYPVG